MTLTPAIIASAYRESNMVPIGQPPTSDQVTEGLARLNVIVAGVYGFEVGDPLTDWPVGIENIADYTGWDRQFWSYPPSNIRLVADSAQAETIYFNPDPSDGARMALIDPRNRLAAAPITVDGNGRAIEGAASVTVNTNGAARIWLYRADRGDWVRLSELTGDVAEEFPFPMQFDDYFITRLAMRINPRYGRSLSEETLADMELAKRKLISQYTQDTIVYGDPGAARLTNGYGDQLYLRSGDTVGNYGRRYRQNWMR